MPKSNSIRKMRRPYVHSIYCELREWPGGEGWAGLVFKMLIGPEEIEGKGYQAFECVVPLRDSEKGIEDSFKISGEVLQRALNKYYMKIEKLKNQGSPYLS